MLYSVDTIGKASNNKMARVQGRSVSPQWDPNGGQLDLVWLPARVPHVGPQYVWRLAAYRNQDKYPPE